MGDALAESKRTLRLRVSRDRREMSPASRAAASARIARHVMALPEFEEAPRVAAYAALDEEASLDAVLEAVVARGRVLLLPRVQGRALAFTRVADLASLRAGAFGVREPPADFPETKLVGGDLVLVPGVAFDRLGGRLGRGGGFYDRSLPDHAIVFGVCFELQLVSVVPMQAHDRRVDGVVTERGVVRSAGGDPGRDPG